MIILYNFNNNINRNATKIRFAHYTFHFNRNWQQSSIRLKNPELDVTLKELSDATKIKFMFTTNSKINVILEKYLILIISGNNEVELNKRFQN